MRILFATVALVVALPGAAYAAVVVINNGLDCSSPGNVIDHDGYQSDNVYVQNVGCDGTVEYPCAFPRDPTEVCLVDGGIVDYLNAFESSTITIAGANFAVNGNPVPYGALTAQTGTLTGTLASGDPIESVFNQGGGSFTGTIELPAPAPALSLLGKLGLGVGLLGAGSLGVGALQRRAG
jgi:hypothetical protein